MRVSRLVAVPTSVLYVDPAIAQHSPKGYSDRDLQEIAATVPAVYERMAQGWQEGDFNAARWSTDPQARKVGDTYHCLWQDRSVSQSLHAHHDGRTLVVDSGNHRVRAAQQIGVPVIPVWVDAPTQHDLDRIEAACDQRITHEGADYYSQAHRQHEAERSVRGMAVGERLSKPTDPERDLGHRAASASRSQAPDVSMVDLARDAARAREQQSQVERERSVGPDRGASRPGDRSR